MKFAHISDTHIKNLKYHFEYREVFRQLYDRLKKEKVDYIIHCGDIAHTKTQISPEFVEMCSQFFRNLEAIAPTYIILGNHDGNLKNSSRQDALTPIVEALDLPNLHLLKNSGETILNDEFCLNVLSVFDRDRWVTPTDKDKINIALYHGSISNCKTDMNWVMTKGEDTLDIFKDYDFAMLGDIHRRQFLDEEGRIWYAGSTVQQNHGETNDKGILIWKITSKDEWDIEPIVLKNPKPFMTIELTPKGRMPHNVKVPVGARLRLVSNNNLPLATMRRAMQIAKHRFNPESISFLNRAAGQRGNVEEITNDLKVENLRDPKIQEELMRKYLKEYQVTTQTLTRIYEINRHYNKSIENSEEISRNINWKLKSFKWDYLFNYGKSNHINFDSLHGIIGIFGKNFSGKSSVVDAALYTLFNTTSKNERKNLNVINQNHTTGCGELVIDIGEKRYTISRESEKYTKRLKGEETLEAKTELNFEVYDMVTGETTSLNGNTRNQTDANIRKHFGSIEDFFVSSLASQHGALAFIDEGSTRRKEIIAKFLDLEVFDKKFRLAKEDSVDMKVLLKKHQDRDYDSEISELHQHLATYKENVEINKQICTTLREEVKTIQASVATVNETINSIPNKYIDITKLKKRKREQETTIAVIHSKIVESSKEIDLKKSEIVIAARLLEVVNIEDLDEKQIEIQQVGEKEVKFLKELEEIEKKRKLLDGIPCGESYPTCKFIRDANIAVACQELVEGDLRYATKRLKILNPQDVEREISDYKKLQTQIATTEKTISELSLEREKNKGTKVTLEARLKDVISQIEEYNSNKEAIENIERLLQLRVEHDLKAAAKEDKICTCDNQTLELVKLVGSCEQQIENLQQQKQEQKHLQESFSAYDLFMRCMHPNGIAYDIIKKKIPVINQEIAKILTNIVEFEIIFESSGNKFDIFIKHPQHDARPIEMASGSEKTMGAMAIRLALLSVSSLPKGDLFILDEPGTALDEENMEGFIRILALIKVYFKNVLLISHLDSLKDCVDRQIIIEKNNGYAKVNQ